MSTDANAAGAADAAAVAAAEQSAGAGAAPTAAAAPATPAAPSAPATPVVPATYDLKLPDGASVDPAIVERTAALARTLGLSNEAGQQLLDKTVAEASAPLTAFLEANKPGEGTAWKARVGEYETQAKADPEIGGPKFDASVEKAQQVLAKFGTPGLKQALDTTGFGSHPEVLRLLAKIGGAMSEGSLVLPGAQDGGAATKKAPHEIMYPDPPKA
jgi:hypothetical protein